MDEIYKIEKMDLYRYQNRDKSGKVQSNFTVEVGK